MNLHAFVEYFNTYLTHFHSSSFVAFVRNLIKKNQIRSQMGVVSTWNNTDDFILLELMGIG